jgi:hypothetical protein
LLPSFHIYWHHAILQYVILIASPEGRMAKILEEIQTRLAEAQKRLVETSQAFQLAQQAQQAAQHNFNVWNMAAQLEQKDEQVRQAKAVEKQLPLPAAIKQEPAPIAVVAAPTVTEQSTDNSDSINKTAVVRDLLGRHPAGMSAVDIWKEVGGQFNHRPYLYSVLKRLRDRDEIVKRRNKYFLTAIPKPEEVKEQAVVH